MKKIIILCFFFFNLSFALAQDIIVLKKDESEIKCKIISVDNNNISYQQWNSDSKTIHSVRRVDVLSYLLEAGSKNPAANNNAAFDLDRVNIPGRKKTNPSTGNSHSRNHEDILGIYHSGETMSGYVVLNSGDTIRGLITIKNVAENQLSVKFKDDKGADFNFTSSDLSAYGYGNVNYKKMSLKFKGEVINDRRIKDGSCFLHVEVDGPAKLYRFYRLTFKKSLFLNYTDPPFYLGQLKYHFLVINPQGEFIFTKGRTIKGTINRLFTDSEYLIEQINKKTPKANEFPDIIRDYNMWYLSHH